MCHHLMPRVTASIEGSTAVAGPPHPAAVDLPSTPLRLRRPAGARPGTAQPTLVPQATVTEEPTTASRGATAVDSTEDSYGSSRPGEVETRTAASVKQAVG
jgi:hypothetical protein